mmetsp:Transcript_11938/g.29279  ORF Transcript_11938/g.29279 Transcript_11938/m.29279 type:complete len:231 (-) Transcript_11938:140-832(-)
MWSWALSVLLPACLLLTGTPRRQPGAPPKLVTAMVVAVARLVRWRGRPRWGAGCRTASPACACRAPCTTGTWARTPRWQRVPRKQQAARAARLCRVQGRQWLRPPARMQRKLRVQLQTPPLRWQQRRAQLWPRLPQRPAASRATSCLHRALPVLMRPQAASQGMTGQRNSSCTRCNSSSSSTRPMLGRCPPYPWPTWGSGSSWRDPPPPSPASKALQLGGVHGACWTPAR